MINFDANSSYGLLPSLRDELLEILEGSLNPSSIHRAGQKARAHIEEAREQIGRLIDLRGTGRIVFTSGATEANNWAVSSPSLIGKGEIKAVSSKVEHPSVLEPLKRLASLGADISLVSPSADGTINPDDVLSLCDHDTSLVSLMLVNNEIGTISPIGQISKTVSSYAPHAIRHADAVQGLGKMMVSFVELDVHLMSLSAHKIGGLQGTGALVIRDDLDLPPYLLGGAQEVRYRAGTENLAGIVSFGLAARTLLATLDERVEAMRTHALYFLRRLLDEVPFVQILSDPLRHAPNTVAVHVPGVRGDDLVVALDLQGVCVSSGAACASGKPDPSHVLLALGMSEEDARSTIRVSFCHDYDDGVVERGTSAIANTLRRLVARR